MAASIIRSNAFSGGTTTPQTQTLDCSGGNFIAVFVYCEDIASVGVSIGGVNLTRQVYQAYNGTRGLGIWTIPNQWSGNQTVSVAFTNAKNCYFSPVLISGVGSLRHTAINTGDDVVTLNAHPSADGILLTMGYGWSSGTVTGAEVSPLVNIQNHSHNDALYKNYYRSSYCPTTGASPLTREYTINNNPRALGISIDPATGRKFFIPPLPIG